MNRFRPATLQWFPILLIASVVSGGAFGDEDKQRVEERIGACVEKKKDQRQRDRDDDREPKLSALEMLELPAVGDVIAGGKGEFTFDAPPHLLHESGDVSIRHVALNDDSPLLPFARDRRWAFSLFDAGESLERDAFAGGRRDQDASER